MQMSKLDRGTMLQSALLSKVTGQATPAAIQVQTEQQKKRVQRETGLTWGESLFVDEKDNKTRIVKKASTGKVQKIFGKGETLLEALQAC